jgi:hypothetical protein
MDDDKDIDQYLIELQEDGAWGGDLEILALGKAFQFNCTVHQDDGQIYNVFTFDAGTVPTVNISFHNGDHYNSVRRINDPGTGPANPVGHELTIQEVHSLEEQKEVTHKTNDFEMLVTQAMSVLGAHDREIMSVALMKFSEGGKLDFSSISKHSAAIQTL